MLPGARTPASCERSHFSPGLSARQRGVRQTAKRPTGVRWPFYSVRWRARKFEPPTPKFVVGAWGSVQAGGNRGQPATIGNPLIFKRLPRAHLSPVRTNSRRHRAFGHEVGTGDGTETTSKCVTRASDRAAAWGSSSVCSAGRQHPRNAHCRSNEQGQLSNHGFEIRSFQAVP